MRRKIIIVVATFSVLLAAFLAYYFIRGGSTFKEQFLWHPPHPSTEGELTTLPGIGEVSAARGLRLYQYDKQHRLRAFYSANHTEKVGDKILLTKPYIRWHLRGGQIITIQADRGTVVAEDVGGKARIHTGQLSGNVRVIMDRGTAPHSHRPPLEKRPQDAIRVELEEAFFDNDLLTIQSDSPVKVFSKEADIFGKGLRIAWSESPSRLNELKIMHGDFMRIRAEQNRLLGGIRLPGGTGTSRTDLPESQTGQATPTTSRFTRPTTIPHQAEVPFITTARTATNAPSSASSVEGAKKATRLDKATSSMPSSIPATSPASQPATRPVSPKEPTPAPIVPDTYVATLTGKVLITSGPRRIEGAKKLTLIFYFTPPKEQEEKSPVEPATRPVSVVKKPPAVNLPVSRPPQSTLPTRPSTTTVPAEPLIVRWTGPLILKPLRGYDKVIPNRFDVSAVGQDLTLSDGQATASCKRFNFYSTKQVGELIGDPASPVKLRTVSKAEISVPIVNFNSATGTAELIGPGSMKLPSGQSLKLTGASTKPARARQKLLITWRDGVQAKFGQRKIVQNGKVIGSEEFIRQADFFGEVVLQQDKTRNMKARKLTVRFYQPSTPDEPINRVASLHAAGNVQLTDTQSEDFIQSDQLDVEMSPIGEERSYPRRVSARGNISARQDKTDIKADKSLIITFGPVKNENTDETEIKPRRLEAAGGVEITDRSGEQPTIARADTLISNLLDKTAVLKGAPARIIQKDKLGKENFIEGDEIFLDGLQESASITGKGRLKFYSDTNISGKKTTKPEPVQISWTKKMNYRGKEQTAIAVGNVHLATAEDELDCENLYVLFAGKEISATKSPEKKSKATTGTLAGPVYSKVGRISMVVAKGNARLRSYRRDKQGFLLQRVQLRSNHLLYQADKNILSCSGRGTLVAEDYRQPIDTGKNKPGTDDFFAGRIDRPSQSAFSWSKSMVLDWSGPKRLKTAQNENTIITMVGDVRMAHRSGRQIVMSEKLPIRRWKDLPTGRNITLRCDRILVQFAPAQKATKPSKTPPQGITIGPVDLFDARGENVNLRDGPREVFCQRIFYRRRNDVAIIWGSLPGKTPKDAILYYQDEKKGVLNTWKSPKIIWFRKTNRIVTKSVESHGGW